MGARAADGYSVAAVVTYDGGNGPVQSRSRQVMAELDNIPQPARQSMERIGTADLVIGLLAGSRNEEIGAAVASVREALATLSSSVRTVVIHTDPAAEQTVKELV